ncbi:MAG: dihydroorotase [Oscillospiraceae bacterium]|jgi:dihydroorotase|nr:dihydroorotase [Oscillospiraceae bacterium]
MLLIKNGRIVDPAAGTDRIGDLFVENGKIAPLHRVPGDLPPDRILDASDKIVAPGLVDMHVHFRDPGLTYKEDILTGTDAAAAGGVTTAVCMPNTKPVIDTPETVRYVLDKGAESKINLLTYAAVTRGQLGRELTDMEALYQAGAAAFSDDGVQLQSASLMRQALQNAKVRDLLICSHCEDTDMVQNYAVNEGIISKRLGLPGRPAIAEELMVARDAMLALETGARVHICHVSTAGSVEIIRHYKAKGARLTCETCPQYFTLTEDIVPAKGAMARVNPPLRTAADMEAIIEGLRDGTIDVIATDHAPHSDEEKSRPLPDAPSGMSGLETSLAVTYTRLCLQLDFSVSEILRLMSTAPAKLLGLEKGRLAVGDDADLIIFDPAENWTVDTARFHSKGHNTPFAGSLLTGRVKYTVCGGKVVYADQ